MPYQERDTGEVVTPVTPKTPPKVFLKIGDTVCVKAGGLSGKIGTIDQVTGNTAIVSSPSFGMPQTIPLVHLEVMAS
jgi:hypothetical protein